MKICVFRKKERNEVRMADEFDAEKIMGFPLMPVGPGIDTGNCWYFGVVAINPGSDDYPAEIKVISAKIVDDFELVCL